MIAYFDCFSGISGDMTLGAFVDLGVPLDWLEKQLAGIPLTGFDLSVESVSRSGIGAKNIFVNIKDHAHPRNYSAIKSLISGSPFSEKVKGLSLKIFEKIAVAESGIHGCPKEKVHFHEVGGVDAIVDIVGTALCMEYLDIKKVVASKIPLGSGFVECCHGRLPVPAPATVEILKDVPVYGTQIQCEIVTPTGAAIITSLADSFGPMPDMLINKTGYGSGKRKLEPVPNLLRIVLGKVHDKNEYEKDRVVIVETSIDDMNPELFGFVMERLFEDGALDVCLIPVFMKKNRPGTLLQVLCTLETKEVVIKRILTETTSLGVRYYDADRSKFARSFTIIKTSYGDVKVKLIKEPDGSVRRVPEYEACKKIAVEKKIPLRVVYENIIKESTAS